MAFEEHRFAWLWGAFSNEVSTEISKLFCFYWMAIPFMLYFTILLAPREHLKPDRHTYFHSYLYSSAFYNSNFKKYIKHVFNHGSPLHRKVTSDFFPHWSEKVMPSVIASFEPGDISGWHILLMMHPQKSPDDSVLMPWPSLLVDTKKNWKDLNRHSFLLL